MESDAQARSRRRLAGFLLTMGVLHFAVPERFDAIVPRWVPGPARFWTWFSGTWELSSGVLLARPSTRRAGAWAAAATFVAVYPANVQMAIDHPPRSAAGVGLWLRLPAQLPLVAWALRLRN
jgi:uncharacterized membrane protein